MHYVYKIEHLVNGKVYIGGSNDPNIRKSNHKSSSDNFNLKKAIEEDGWDYFSFEVLCCCLDLEARNITEANFIEQYNATNPEKGYNVSKDGTGKFEIGHPQYNTGRTHFQKGLVPWNKGLPPEQQNGFGIPRSEETKARISASNTGKTRSDETKANISKAHESRDKSTYNTSGLKKQPRKFSDEQIVDIRTKLKNGNKVKDLAVEYQVSQQTIYDIKNNKIYT